MLIDRVVELAGGVPRGRAIGNERRKGSRDGRGRVGNRQRRDGREPWIVQKSGPWVRVAKLSGGRVVEEIRHLILNKGDAAANTIVRDRTATADHGLTIAHDLAQ